MSEQIEWQGHALAGLLQATSLVSRLARTGLIPQDNAETSLASLFVFDASDLREIYRGTRGLSHGFRVLDDLLSGRNLALHGDAVRYAFDSVKIVRLLMRDPTMLEQLRAGLRRIAAQEEDLVAQPWLAGELAALYQQTISTLPLRIRVTGDIRHLQKGGNADRIRALLLAAIRSAMLWHQVGGRPWKALLARSALKQLASRHLTSH